MHDTVTWPCQSSKTVVIQNRCQKWKEHVKNMQVAKFEAPNIAEWVFMAAWIFGKFEGFVWETLLVSRPCTPATFSIQIFVIFQFSNSNKNSLFNAKDLKLGNYANCDTPLSFLLSIVVHARFYDWQGHVTVSFKEPIANILHWKIWSTIFVQKQLAISFTPGGWGWVVDVPEFFSQILLSHLY